MIIYISHRLNELTKLADRVVVLRDGEISGELVGKDINHDRMINLMVGRSLDFSSESSSEIKERGHFKVENLVTKAFPDSQINFEVSVGEILGIAGLIGAGRSELMRAIFGIDKPVSGQITLNEEQLKIKVPSNAIAKGIFLIPEDRRKQGIIAEMDVTENVTIPNLKHFSKRGWIFRKREKRAARMQKQSLQIKTEGLETPLWQLSGGNQQKVVLAKWLDMNPRMMIFDEPTRGIDVGSKLGIYKIMRQLVASKVIVVVVSSDMEELIRISDRILVMRDGSITGEIERKDFTEERIMKLAVA